MKYAVLAAAVLMTTGCATIMSPKEQSINVTSSTGTPIEVTVDGKKTSTPGAVMVTRDGKEKVINTSTEGCAPSTPVQKSLAPMFWGNIVIGGFFGSTTDNATGKAWNYQDNVVVQCAK